MSYEPIITPGRNFFLVSTEYKESCSAWCRKQIGTTLRTCQGRIIIIDATGEYANLALDHDRLIREKIPSIIIGISWWTGNRILLTSLRSIRKQMKRRA